MRSPQSRCQLDEACAAAARACWQQTRGLGRRDFLRALAEAAAGSALLSPLVAIAPRHRPRPPSRPSPISRYGGAWKQAIIRRVLRAVHQEDRHPGAVPGAL